jgi:hypothetical protein
VFRIGRADGVPGAARARLPVEALIV